ncbi:EamA-like transporter family protein [Bacillus mangrovi]|uniref:EamA-like transporter family protein n=1 Tax=Metabacillus mangrovi TaxID=1491830 RepID=A0A7X2V593_9BACI|nr:DMT family transporter [Metabacillus mangrovi]MTH54225.1 EamA-like transporter family protein [Metabacillus mangrovi]
MGLIVALSSIIGGILLSAQSSINGAFSRKAGTYESTFLTFITGAMVLIIAVLFFGQGDITGILDAPAWQLSAVWFGVGYLFLTVLAVPQIGVIAANIATVIGQLSAGILIDHFGFFGGTVISFDWQRALALVLMIAALRLVYISNKKAEQK